MREEAGIINIETYGLYVAVVVGLMITPGPGHLLMLSNSLAHGFSRSLATALGDLSANALQMIAAGLGIAALINAFPHALTVIKLLGVMYLVWLGVGKFRQALRADATATAKTSPGSVLSLWLQGFITSMVNPKAVVFFAALFPQFIEPTAPFWPQLAILSLSYVFIDGFFLLSYALGAQWLALRLQNRGKTVINAASGVFMIMVAALLALKEI